MSGDVAVYVCYLFRMQSPAEFAESGAERTKHTFSILISDFLRSLRDLREMNFSKKLKTFLH